MMQIVNVSLNLTAFLLSGVLMIAAILGGNLKAKVFRWFFALVLTTFIGAPGDTLILLLSGTPGEGVHRLIRAIDVLNFGAMGPTLIMAGLYFYEFISTKMPVPRSFIYLHVSLAVLVTALVTAAQFSPILIWLDESNTYTKGSLFWLFELFPVTALLLCAGLTLRNRRYLRTREWVSLLIYTLIPLVSYAAEMLVAGLWLTYLSSAIMLFVLYMNIQVELRHRIVEQDKALAESRMAVMLSQIQPHFIFNTLSSITSVCEDNPLAQKCLITFSQYLRVNMDSLTRKEPIPFAAELEHVRQYLWLEQLRFEERLAVEYDIAFEDFVLPVLTLQPIVENAVRHGITRKAAPGHLRIATRESAQGVRITVRDDGAGFDPQAPQDDTRSHTGLASVRARLWAMCGGLLEVQSAPGEGTTVTIDIPREGRQDT